MNINSSSSSSSSDDSFIISLDEEEDAITRVIINNNILITELIRQHSNQVDVGAGGLVPGRAFINCDRVSANRQLFNDYFSETPMYDEAMFRRRYRMSRSLFLHIKDAVQGHDNYFEQRVDRAGKLGLSPLQKMTAAFRMLAYSVPADATDEYAKIGESTAIESMNKFRRAIVEVFSELYLRSPTSNDIARLLHVGQQRGFPGMLGSLDCMHWKWKNCPTGWAGQYTGCSGKPTIILEAVADYDLWIWHAYFGYYFPSGSRLESSHLFSNLTQGIAPSAHYVIQGKEYNMGYYLADSIYPKWATVMQTIREPRGQKKRHFAMKQEACRKDVERAFGVLQSRFAIVAGPTRFWRKEVLKDIMSACIIMNNMIIEDEYDLSAPIEVARETPPVEVEMVVDGDSRFKEFATRYRQIRDKDAHIAVRNALIEHLWERYSHSDA